MGKDSGSRKKGGNKGILARHKQRKREEAEARNAKTKPEDRRSYRQVTARVVIFEPDRVRVKHK